MSSDLYTAPATKGRPVTLSDSTVLDARSIWVGGAGDLTVQLLDDADGTTTLFSGIAAGTLLPISVKRAYSTGSTASATLKVVALY